MKVTQAKQFLNQFERANQDKQYLTTQAEHHYAIVNTKTEKNLNTAAIADTVEECFETLKGQGISQKHRAELLKKLKTEIKVYNSRVYASKKWYQKIGHWFGSVSTGEKKINTIAELVKVERRTSKEAVKAFQAVEDGFAELRNKNLDKTFQQERKIYMRNFGGLVDNDVLNDQLDGANQSDGFKSNLDDLQKYKETLGISSDTLRDLDAIIAVLTKAYSISILQERIHHKRTPPDLKQNISKELTLRISEDIQDLGENGRVGDQILIPGGYQKVINRRGDTEGHAVLYQIKKVNDKECTFTIINTGDGAKESMSGEAIKNSAINTTTNFIGELWDEFTGKSNKSANANHNVKRELLEDIQYKNVKFENLGEKLLEKIFDSRFHGQQKNPMSIVKKNIHEELTKDKNVRESAGRKHSAQEIGSCVYKSISSWMKPQFQNAVEYNKFKAKTTEWDMEQLKGIHNEIKLKSKSADEKAELAQVEKMLIVGRKVLKKRQNKTR